MTDDSAGILEAFGSAVEQRIVTELGATPSARFSELLDLHNLKGERTGSIRVFDAERIDKASSLSIDIAPGVRYFNIHVMPDTVYRVPRYSFEGMLSGRGSLVSIDLYPDLDLVSHRDYLQKEYAALSEIYNRARHDPTFSFQVSRLAHMRAIASPFFLLVIDQPAADLPALEAYALDYFDAWLDILRSAERLSPEVAAEQAERRRLIARTIIEEDPDRHMVVQVYGEGTTQAIEAATML